ncbi:AAA family ATPase [Anaerocolumna xylanovorans]|uniref:AAA family ATPase n=1 Tax=Anaerocolumna xylanovorans TaxID=100134 RepID=UPI001FA8C678|nr:AAA family ATPase [Anaerocolumna xylanovorans]
MSGETVGNPNIYPYNVFADKEERLLIFGPITILYGNNASGKSTLLNIIANKLQIEGKEYATSNKYGITPYFTKFASECGYTLGEDEDGRQIGRLPGRSRYIKSEDILYEIKKIQQEQILNDGYVYEHIRRGMHKEQTEQLKNSDRMKQQMEYLKFAQEKYSNGETTLQLLDDYVESDALYLLDEPEVSLSPSNQTLLAEKINKMSRFMGCQFIISTHSPFMMGTLNAKIYNLDSKELKETKWTELENVRYFYDFFERHKKEFE